MRMIDKAISRLSFVIKRQMLVSILTLTLLITFISASGLKQQEPSRTIKPDPAIQEAIHGLFREAKNLEEFHTQLTSLRTMAGENLVPQLIYYKLNAKDVVEGMALHIIVRELEISDIDLVLGITPYLGTNDAKLRRLLEELLDGIEKPRERDRDYKAHRNVIEASKDRPPLALIQHMYEKSPGTALITLQRVYLRKSEKITPIIWAEHVVSDVLWKKENRFLKPETDIPVALEQLDILSRHEAWWVRLYVAETLRQNPEFRTPELVERLENDEHELVREELNRPVGTR